MNSYIEETICIEKRKMNNSKTTSNNQSVTIIICIILLLLIVTFLFVDTNVFASIFKGADKFNHITKDVTSAIVDFFKHLSFNEMARQVNQLLW